ncbi:MAG: serine/threonine-protein kinase [Pseudomonadota bacterium]
MPALEIDAATWAQLNQLLDAALDQTPATRGRWIESLGPEFESLKPQLRDLLSREAVVETADFLGNLPRVDILDGAKAPGVAGESIGPYRLVRELGAGGMGAVWLADRADGLFRRPVALKLPHPLGSPAGLAERMAREREILATLDHPHIAKLFDAGVTVAGQPFLAIEHVEGVSLGEYCASGGAGDRLPLPQMLDLFRQVADAVAYAHGKLVLHRDLKPANILVDKSGNARLLDFGIAKLLDEGQTRDTRLTEISGKALTPDYASPEQILGEPLTVASDVYSLGVILFEMLAGTRPYKLARESRRVLEDAILQTEPPLPSEVAPPRMRRVLRGDLDTIVMRALKKNSAERYATVDKFSEDIARYLDHRPVLAQPDSRWYRLRKFAARNTLSITAASLVSIAVLGGAGVAIWQARVAIAERDRAEEIRSFIATLFQEADPYRQFGKPLGAAELLRNADADVARGFSSRPELRLELRGLIAASLLGLADLPAAEATARKAVADSTQHLGATSLATLRARVVLAEVYAARRDNPKLRAELAEVLPRARTAAHEHPELLVRALRASSDLAIEESRFAESLAPAREAFELARRRLGERDWLTVGASTGLVEAELFARVPTDEQLREAERGMRLVLAATGGREDSPRAIQMRDIRVRILLGAGDKRGAIAENDRLIDAATRTFGADGIATGYALMNCNRERAALGDVATALRNSNRAMEIIGPRIAHDSHEYLSLLSSRAVVRLAARQHEAALQDLQSAEEGSRKLSGGADWDTSSLMIQRAHLLARLGRFAEAHSVMTAALRNDVNEEDLDWVRRQEGSIARWEGNYPLAIAKLLESAALGGDNPSEASRLRNDMELGLAELELGDVRAESTLLEVDSALRKSGVDMHPAFAEVMTGLARIKLAQHASEASLPLLQRADAFWREFDARNRGAGEVAYWLGRAQLEAGQRTAARENLSRAVEILRDSPLPSDRRLVQAARAAVG